MFFSKAELPYGSLQKKKNAESMVFAKGGVLPPPQVWSSFGYFYTDRDMAKIMFYSLQNMFCI